MISKEAKTFQVEAIIRQYYAQVYRYCYIRTSNTQLAQDLTQESFCRFFQRMDTYLKEVNIRQIIFTIAHHLCVDHYRRHAHANAYLSHGDEYPDSHQPEAERSIALTGFLNKLHPHQKETLVLFYYYDFKIREIADITGTSIPNVKYRLKAGKKILKRLLQKEGMTYEEWF